MQLHVAAFAIIGTRRKIDLAELVEEPWLLVPSRSVWHATIEATFSAHGLKMPKPSVVSFSVHLRNSLLPTGMSGSAGSFHAHRRDALCVQSSACQLSLTPRTAAVTALRNRTLNRVVGLFIDCAREVVKPLVKKVDSIRSSPGAGD